MARDLTPLECAGLEELIDRCSLQSVLMAVSDICDAKSDHVLSNWQDKPLSRRWATLCGAVGVIVPKADGL